VIDGSRISRRLAHDFAAFILDQRRSGRSAAELDALMGRWAFRSERPAIAVVEPERELRRLIETEVAHALPGVCVTGIRPSGVRSDGECCGGRCLVARPEVARSLAYDPALVDLFSLRTNGLAAHARDLRCLRAGDVMVLLTTSRLLRRHAGDLLAGRLGNRVELVCPRIDRVHELRPLLRIARLVLADVAVGQRLSKMGPGCPCRLIRVVHEGWIREMARYIGARNRHGGAARNMRVTAELEGSRGIR